MSLWADAGGPGAAFAASRKGPAHLEAVERVKDWTRARFRLGDADTVVLQEGACTLPGFPPMETLVAFWTADGTRHHFKCFKRVEEVVADDIPPAWLKDSLAGDIACDCC
jgi:nitrate reductase delta subunit